MGDLEGAPAVHFNFPLLRFSLNTTFKSRLPLHVSLFLWNRGGLVNILQGFFRQKESVQPVGLTSLCCNWVIFHDVFDQM